MAGNAMHLTTVKTKDGCTAEGYLWTVRPSEGWFTLSVGDDVLRFEIADCASVVTENDRISRNRVGDVDELERWK
jgi:hypothetical protein